MSELEGLRAEVEEYAELCDRQAALLTRTINVLRGDPPPLTSWSHHDVPERAQDAMTLLRAVESYDSANQSDLPLGLLDSIRALVSAPQ